MISTALTKPLVIESAQAQLPNLLALYAFGSRIQSTASEHSDLDLAVLVAGYADQLLLFDLAGQLADVVGCEVDLVDLRAASTVMQYQIITTGERWWQIGTEAVLYEAAILSEKTALDTARADLIDDINQRGTVYGR